MTKIAVVGGHGQIGQRLCAQLAARGDEPVAIGRRDDVADRLKNLGVHTRRLDIEASTVADFATAFAGCDAVVFTAGGGPDGNKERKRTVDLEGALKAIAAAEQLGIRRYLQVSAMGVDAPVDPERGEVWAAYVAAKRDSDAAVRASSLDWTILRPGRLTDAVVEHRITLGVDLPPGEVSRDAVADVLCALLDTPETAGVQWDLVAGTRPIREEIRARLDAESA